MLSFKDPGFSGVLFDIHGEVNAAGAVPRTAKRSVIADIIHT